MANTETTTYEIVTLEDGEWVTDYVGAENTFNTIDEALEAIRSLRALGGEWADTIYGVRGAGDTEVLYQTLICAYCNAGIEPIDAVPVADDDEAWAALEGDHALGCEWVDTRAGRHNAWHSFTIDIRRMADSDWEGWCESDDDRILGGGADPQREFDTVFVEAPSRTQAREYLDTQLLPGMTISD